MTRAFHSAAYWEERYRAGGTSGSGSYGRLAAFKAGIINEFVAVNSVTSAIELGCGDGNLLSLLSVPDYTGVDVSPTALARCAARFPRRRFVAPAALGEDARADLALSVDVIFHLVEDAVFADHMRTLFRCARRFVLIYASDVDMAWPAAHVRHRRFSDHVAATEPGWQLLAHVPNRYPFDPKWPDETSFADFFIYERIGHKAADR